jgi:hypothetical protein
MKRDNVSDEKGASDYTGNHYAPKVEKGRQPIAFGSEPALDCKYSAGKVGKPSYNTGYPSDFIKVKSADTTNSTTNLNQTASGENLSAKFKYPRVSESVPEAGKNQYTVHE